MKQLMTVDLVLSKNSGDEQIHFLFISNFYVVSIVVLEINFLKAQSENKPVSLLSRYKRTTKFQIEQNYENVVRQKFFFFLREAVL